MLSNNQNNTHVNIEFRNRDLKDIPYQININVVPEEKIDRSKVNSSMISFARLASEVFRASGEIQDNERIVMFVVDPLTQSIIFDVERMN